MIRTDSCKKQTALAASHNCIETGWPKETVILKRKVKTPLKSSPWMNADILLLLLLLLLIIIIIVAHRLCSAHIHYSPQAIYKLFLEPQFHVETEVNMSKTHGRDAITNMKMLAKEISYRLRNESRFTGF